MISLKHAIVAGFLSGFVETGAILLPVYVLGGSAIYRSPGQALSYLFLIIPIAFFSGYLLADARDGIMALVLAEATALLASALILNIASPGGLPQISIIVYLAILSVPTFLFGMIGTVTGSFLGMLADEDLKTYKISLRRHKVVFLVALIFVVAIISAFAAEAQINHIVDQAVSQNTNQYTLKGPFIVANESITLASSSKTYDANFSSMIYRGGEFRVSWISSQNVSFHVLMSRDTQEVLTIASSSNSSGFVSDRSVPYDFPPFVDLKNPYSSGAFIAWFRNESCSSSQCAPGWLQYEIQISHY